VQLAKAVVGPNQISLIDDLPDHSKKKSNIREIRTRDSLVAIPPNYVYVQTDQQMRACVEALEMSEAIAVDTETRRGPWWSKKAVSLNVYAPSTGKAYFIPNRMVYAQRNFTDDEIQSYFEDVLTNPRIAKVGQAFKYDLHRIRETWNIEVDGFSHDTLLASIVLNENEDHDLESLAVRYLKAPRWKIAHEAAFELWPLRTATLYAGRDAEMTYKLYEFQRKHLDRPKLENLYYLFYDMEMPVVKLVYAMEKRGVGWDSEYFESTMKPTIVNAAAEAANKVLSVTGPINLNAPAQVSSAFYDMLGYPRIEGSNGVAEPQLAALKAMGNQTAADMLTYRSFSTIDKMFVKKLPGHVVNGRIHCTFNTIGADTGRMSAKDPNLMQLPKRIGPVIRRGIIPSPGKVFVTMDFGQMELRVLAHFSDDPGLIQAFVDGKDIHTAVMCGMLGVSYAEYEADPDRPEFVAKRVLAKTVNFGVLYGMGATKLAWKASITIDEAKAFIRQYFATYPGIKRFINRMHTQAYDNGFVETLLGRKRRLPDARSSNKMLVAMAERLAVNAPIQGTVADLCKMTMIKQDELITANHWPYELLLQIHDEVLYEVPLDWLQAHQQSLVSLRYVMENIYPLRVPIVCSQEVLSRWGSKTQLHEDDEEDVA
jgi:DNA polymerase-1